MAGTIRNTGLGVALLAAMISLSAGKAHAEGFFQRIFAGPLVIEPVEAVPGKNMAAQFKRQRVHYQTDQKPGTIIIDSKNKFLYLVEGDDRAMRYGVGVGREGFGWQGEVRVGRKAEWPTWTPPSEMRSREKKKGRILPASMKGGPENPLGARAMYLYDGGRDTMFRIHGTSEPWTIGHNVSSGCIRMVNDDVADLYERTPVGTKVIVQ